MKSLKRIKSFLAIGLLLTSAFVVGPTARADTTDCKEAVDAYNTSVDTISGYLKRYSSCVGSSKGHDDCSSEFRRLRSAQSDFESAVSAYQSDCDD